MKLANAQTLLLEKMAEHGLVELGWKMNWDDAKKRFGYCSIGKKVISLSRPLTEANPESEVLDTILHEIAHALASLEHQADCGHDERWKAVCRRIGARPEACFGEDDVVMPEAPWVLAHAETGEVFYSYLRKPAKDVTKMWIRGRKEETLGKLVIRATGLGRIETFSRPALEQFSSEIMAAIEAVLADRGVTVERTKGSFNDYEYNLSLRFRTGLPEGKTPDQADFEKHAFIFGLSEEDFHKPFRSHGKTYLLCGFKLKNHTYPIIGLCPRTGRKFKFEMHVLDSLGKA
jgi:hypothetical protein